MIGFVALFSLRDDSAWSFPVSVKPNPAAKNRDLPAAAQEIAKFGAHPKVTMEPGVQPHAGVADIRRREETGCGSVAARDENIQLSIDRRIRNVIIPIDGEGGETTVARNQGNLAAQPKSFPEDFFSANCRVAEEFTIERSAPG
jgi:hypothetical protein